MFRRWFPWIVVGLLLSGFVALGVLVYRGGPTVADLRVLFSEVHDRDNTSTWVAHVVSWLGAFPAVVVLSAGIWAGMDHRFGPRVQRRMNGRFITKWPIVVAGLLLLAGESTAMAVIKGLVGRSRPPERWRLAVELAPSFPSGHTSAAAAIGVFSVLVSVTAGVRGARLAVSIVLAAGWMLTIAWARLYLGVHWLTDVMAGAMLGSAAAIIVWVCLIRPKPARPISL